MVLFCKFSNAKRNTQKIHLTAGVGCFRVTLLSSKFQTQYSVFLRAVDQQHQGSDPLSVGWYLVLDCVSN